jgi:hypothetical protein
MGRGKRRAKRSGVFEREGDDGDLTPKSDIMQIANVT